MSFMLVLFISMVTPTPNYNIYFIAYERIKHLIQYNIKQESQQ